MPLLSRELLNRVSFLGRHKKPLIYGGIIVFAFAALLSGGFFVYRQHHKQAKQSTSAVQTLPKGWVLKYFAVTGENDPKVGGPQGDPDGDLLSNYLEYMYHTNPTKEDTDKDGEIDGFEVAFGRNPTGPGDMVLTAEAKNYVKDYIANDQRLADFSEKKISEQVLGMLQPEKAVALDAPDDKELVVTNTNDVPAFEKYYDATNGLTSTTDWESQDITDRLPDGMTAEEIDGYIGKLSAVEKVLKQTPVPSQIINIHKLKIAQVRAGIRMFELVRDEYKQGYDNQRFWHDVFYQYSAAETANQLELAAWQELGLKLKDVGGI